MGYIKIDQLEKVIILKKFIIENCEHLNGYSCDIIKLFLMNDDNSKDAFTVLSDDQKTIKDYGIKKYSTIMAVPMIHLEMEITRQPSLSRHCYRYVRQCYLEASNVEIPRPIITHRVKISSLKFDYSNDIKESFLERYHKEVNKKWEQFVSEIGIKRECDSAKSEWRLARQERKKAKRYFDLKYKHINECKKRKNGKKNSHKKQNKVNTKNMRNTRQKRYQT